VGIEPRRPQQLFNKSLINNDVDHDGQESCQYTHQSHGTFGRMTGYLPDRINQENVHGLGSGFRKLETGQGQGKGAVGQAH
jgi:hypothetical protein